MHGSRPAIISMNFSFRFFRNIFGLFTIVYINHVRAVFVVDTGAQIAGIKSEKIAQLKAEKQEVNCRLEVSAETRRDMQGLVADSVQLGGTGGFKHGDDCTGFLRFFPSRL